MTDATLEAELIRLRAGMLAYARHMATGYPAIDAEDLLQSAYLHTWARRESIRHDDAVLMYVRKAVRNALISVLRSGSWKYTAPMDEQEREPDQTRHMELLEARLDVEHLASLVQSPRYRNAIRLRLRGEEPDMQSSTYKVQLHRGILAARAAA